MLTNVLDSYYLDGVGKLAVRTVTFWKPHKVVCIRCEKQEYLATDEPSTMSPRKFCVGTGGAHGL